MLDKLVRFRWLLLILIVVVVGAVSPGLKTAVIPDNALTIWFLETDPQLQTYREFHEEFGNDEVILVLVDTPEGAFQPAVLKELQKTSQAIEAVDGVARVHSVLTVKDAWDSEDGLRFDPLVPTPIPEDAEQLAGIEKRVQTNPLFTDRVVRRDGKQAMLWVEMAVMDEFDAQRDRIVAEVREAAQSSLGERTNAMGGIGVIYSGLNVITQQDFGTFLSVAYLLMFLLLWWVFRSVRIMFAAIGVISLGTMLSLGIYGLLGHQMNMVTVVLPIMIIILGVADAIHVPSAFRNITRESEGKADAGDVVAALRRAALPVVLTTLTTMAGFLALSSSPMAVIRHLGIFSAIGLFGAMVATFALMPIALHSLKGKYEPPEHAWMHRLLDRAGSFVKSKTGLAAGIAALIAAVAAVGASQVVTDTYTIGYLPDDHEVVTEHAYIEDTWGEYSVLDFVVRPKGDRDVRDPEVLLAMDRFVQEASKHKLIRDGFSLADVYNRMGAVYAGQPEEGLDEPLTPEQIEQLSLFIEPKGFEWDRSEPEYGDNFLGPLMTKQGDIARITLTGEMISAVTLQGLFDDLEQVGNETLGEVADFEPAGYPPLYTVIIDYVMTSQIRSFFIALALIFLMMLAGLRSLRLALISLLPNVFPVLVMMGLMGALGITLDVATATVGAIVIGVAIDDTVHFLYHWKQAEELGLSWEECVDHTLDTAGVAATITTILLVGGFPILMLAGVKTVYYFGLLTTVAAAAALFADLFILPALLKLWPPSGARSDAP